MKIKTSSIKHLFVGLEKEEFRKRSVELLKAVLIVLICILTAFIVIKVLTSGFEISSSNILLVSSNLFLLVSYIILRIYNRFLLSVIIAITTVFLAMTFIALLDQGARDDAVVTYILLIIFTTLLLGRVASYIVSFLSIGSLWLMVYLEETGRIITNPVDLPLHGRDLTVIIIATTALTFFFDKVITRYVREINLSREQLQNLNRELEDNNKKVLKINEDLVVAKNKAEESDRLKTAFLANLSHEIRTPMNGIVGFSELVLMPELDNEEKEKYNKIIAQNCKQLLGVVNDIIDISKIESGVIGINKSPVNLNDEMSDIYKLHSLKASEKKLDLVLHTDFEDQSSMINTDIVKLKQIINNLLDNAIKFTNTGSVHFGYRTIGENLEFYFEDTGIGIPPENRDLIFDRFVQVSSGKKREYDGTGLGLSIVKGYVEKLGGTIHFDSEPGKGSLFCFTLPYEPVEVKAGQTKNQARTKGPLKVLIVEDINTNIILIREMLRSYGFEIIAANSGEEALEIYKNTPDLEIIFMDIKLPGMDGYEVTRRIRKSNKEIPIIAQTAYSLSEDRKKAFDAGCNYIIVKPITKSSLDEVINKAISQITFYNFM